MWPRIDGLRAFGLGPPGAMRDRLNEVGERQVMLDSAGARAAIIEITRVERHRFVDVPWEFARDEGEGFMSIEHWRDGHRSYYAEKEDVLIDDADEVICVWFRVVEGPS